MSKPIAAGDLVMVVKPTPCCGHSMRIGFVAMVLEVKMQHGWCRHCRAPIAQDHWRARLSEDLSEGLVIAVSRLIRIDPPALPESVETEREVAV